jgi:hypothetical protein
VSATVTSWYCDGGELAARVARVDAADEKAGARREQADTDNAAPTTSAGGFAHGEGKQQ